MRSDATALAAALLVLLPATAATEDSPLVAVVQKYREAKKNDDLAAQRALLAPDAAMWFETKEGKGSKLGEEGGGDPWKDWDDFFRSEGTLEDTGVEGRSVRTTVSETNDWYRLVDRPPSRYHVTYDFDPENRIRGVLVHSIPGEPKAEDRLGDFKTWAKANRPGLLERLMPEGKLDPALDKAKLWKTSLLEWRKAAGLPVPAGIP
jgi:hypothetical protein